MNKPSSNRQQTMDRPKKTAIFGGKFDPPHLAHQLTVFLALNKFEMDEVWIVPSFSHPFGFKPSDFEKRIEMCRIMARPWDEEEVKVCGFEREIDLETVYTVDLLKFLTAKFPERLFSLIIGSDNWNVRDKWKNFGEISAICQDIIVVGRERNESPDHKSIVLPDISSSEIRRLIAEKMPFEHLLPAGIPEFIRKNRLYDPPKS